MAAPIPSISAFRDPTARSTATTTPADEEKDQPPASGVNAGTGYSSGQAAPAASSGAFAAPAAPASGGWRPAATTGGTQPSTAVPGATSTGASGTTNGPSPLGPVGNALGAIPGVGGLVTGLTSPTTVDLSPVHAAQNAAFGEAANLGTERYNYAPGTAPTQNVVGLNTADADQTRARQQQALDALTGAANGTVPSAAQLQGREQAGRDIAATMGAARALGGRSAGGVARAATLSAADTLARERNAEEAQRASEQATARNTLADALNAVRGQDITTAGKAADLTQTAYGNNLQSQEKQNDLAEQWRQALLQAQLQAMGIGTTAATGGANAAATGAAASNKFKGGILDTVGSALGL